MTLEQVVLSGVIGLIAGVLGGLAGIGGSMIMLPGLALVLGFDDDAKTRQHVFMAAAMVVNVLVSAPATRRHWKAGAVRMDLAKLILPSMSVAIIAGVLVSNLFSGQILKYMLAVFIALYAGTNLARVFSRRGSEEEGKERTTPALSVGIGTSAGLVGGLLGLGGGVVMVPMLQLFARVPLRAAIGTSAAVMCLTAIIGAIVKLSTLGEHGRVVSEALWIAAAMGPGAVLGGTLGAILTHALPIRAVRGVISVLLLVAAARMAGLV